MLLPQPRILGYFLKNGFTWVCHLASFLFCFFVLSFFSFFIKGISYPVHQFWDTLLTRVCYSPFTNFGIIFLYVWVCHLASTIFFFTWVCYSQSTNSRIFTWVCWSPSTIFLHVHIIRNPPILGYFLNRDTIPHLPVLGHYFFFFYMGMLAMTNKH